MFHGLRSLIYAVDDLDAAKAWYTEVLGKPPYFDEPFYVGFEVGGHELGLFPAGEHGVGATAYWAVTDIDAAHARLVALGATEREPITDVGDGIRLATLVDPQGGVFGIIQNPHAP